MHLEVNRSDLHETRVVDSPPAPIEAGEARLAVRRFGLSANNVTYAVFGDALGYWSFFPAAADGEGWGRIPVWGFAEVVEANGTGLDDGELIYGYLPMGEELIVTPARVGDHGFTDASAHRAGLPAAYNGYTRCAADPVYDPTTEALQMLLRPLFMTDFVLDDWLADNGFFEAGDGLVVLSSASSKTAFGLAHLLSQRTERPEVVGLTSTGNVAFVEGLGAYDRVVTYDDVASLPADVPAVYVDMAGDAGVRRAVHEHLDGLTASVSVGGTHWEHAADDGGELPGPRPTFFFAPDQIVKRREDWGPGGVESRFAEAWSAFLPVVDGWISVVERHGPDAVADTYREVLDGRADPSVAFVLSMSAG